MSKCSSSQIHLSFSLSAHWNAIIPYSFPSSSLSVCSDSLLPAFVVSPLLPLLPQTCCSCSVVSSEMISSVVWCKEGLKQQLCLAPGARGANQPQGIAPRVPFGTNFSVFLKRSAGDSSQVWCWWWPDGCSGQCKWPALLLIPKAWRRGASQKLPLNH